MERQQPGIAHRWSDLSILAPAVSVMLLRDIRRGDFSSLMYPIIFRGRRASDGAWFGKTTCEYSVSFGPWGGRSSSGVRRGFS